MQVAFKQAFVYKNALNNAILSVNFAEHDVN
jgi:hypothetical protein